jgi:hypothetical protein
MKERLNTAENVPGYSDFIRELAAIKYALGPNREDYYDKVAEWALAYEGNTLEFVREKWESIRDSALGWDYLASKVPFVAAQHDFTDEVPASAAYASTNPVEAMLDRYVWCEALERYIDIKTNTPISAKSFNTKNVRVSEFGNSGTKSAEAQFQNNPAARKVEIANLSAGAGCFRRRHQSRRRDCAGREFLAAILVSAGSERHRG